MFIPNPSTFSARWFATLWWWRPAFYPLSLKAPIQQESSSRIHIGEPFFLSVSCKGTCPGPFALQSADPTRNGQIQSREKRQKHSFSMARPITNSSNKFENKLSSAIEWVKDEKTIPESSHRRCTRSREEDRRRAVIGFEIPVTRARIRYVGREAPMT